MTTEEVKELIGDFGSLVSYNFKEFVTSSVVMEKMNEVSKLGLSTLKPLLKEKFPDHYAVIMERFKNRSSYFKKATFMATILSFDLKNYPADYNDTTLNNDAPFNDIYKDLGGSRLVRLVNIYKNKHKFTTADFKRHLEQGYNGNLDMFNGDVKSIMIESSSYISVSSNSFKTTIEHGEAHGDTTCNSLTSTSYSDEKYAYATLYHIITNAIMYDVRTEIDNRRYHARMIQPNADIENMYYSSYGNGQCKNHFHVSHRDVYDLPRHPRGYVNTLRGRGIFVKSDNDYNEDVLKNLVNFCREIDTVLEESV